MKTLTILIPAYNEEKTIKESLTRLSKFSFFQKAIVINDSSNDKTEEILKSSYFSDCQIIRHKKNKGQSESIRTGILLSKYNSIITLDGDLQNDPSDIPKLIDIYQNKEINYDLVGGVRKKRMDNLIKKISSLFANYVRKFILNDDCNDTGCGLKIFTKRIFLEFPFFNGIHRFLPALFKGYGYNTIFINVNHRKRNYGVSKYGTISFFNKSFLYGIIDIIKVKKIINKQKAKHV